MFYRIDSTSPMAVFVLVGCASPIVSRLGASMHNIIETNTKLISIKAINRKSKLNGSLSQYLPCVLSTCRRIIAT
jgi:hypothetical protein